MVDLFEILEYGFYFFFTLIYYAYTATKKNKESKKNEPNVVCVNCKTSLKDPGTNLCSYCGLDLYIVQKDSLNEIAKSDKSKLDHKKLTITCLNCNFAVVNPTTNLCPNCGLDMLTKSSYKNCASCGSEYNSKLTECPICGAN